MKRILIVIPSFEIGGTNTSLINMIANFDSSRFGLSIYAINNQGPLRFAMEPYAKVLNPSSNESTGIKGKKHSIFIFLKKVFRVFRTFGVDFSSLYYKRIANTLSKSQYDCVVAFQEGNATKLVSYFKNNRKIAWVRSEYSRYISANKIKPEVEIYNRFDFIINVSKTAKNNFLSVMPKLKDKTLAIYNLLNKDRVYRLAEEECSIPGENTFTLISIGRVDPVKHFSEIPDMAHSIKEIGCFFKWLIIGGKTENTPEEYDLIQKKIREYGLGNTVFLMGYQSNPYSFLKNSQLLVCLSESETFNHTFAEARLLGVPVLTVNYESAPEFINKGEGGIIVERSMIASTIREIISDKKLYYNLRIETQQFDYDNESILNSIYTVVS